VPFFYGDYFSTSIKMLIFAPMKLSVIIPVYRVEKSLGACVGSVLAQEVDDMEGILVDDGSPDGSGTICDEMSATDLRIQTIHQKNGGLSAARNTGIRKSAGDVITFVDSDDLLAPSTYKPLLEKMEEHPEYDILEFPITSHHGKPNEQTLSLEETIYTDMADYWLRGKAYKHSYACNKLFRRKLFCNLSFPEGRVFEDIATLPALLKEAHMVATTATGRYLYSDNPEGITVNADRRALEQLLKAHVDVLDNHPLLLRGEGLTEYFVHVMNIQIDVCRLGGQVFLNDRGARLNPFRTSSFSNMLKVALVKLIGIEKTCQLHKKFKNNPS
jgi:glycosyltransferase involved in cell wall biosynthesis